MTQESTPLNLRSQDEIVKRLERYTPIGSGELDSFYRVSVLADVLDFEHSESIRQEHITAEEWGMPSTADDIATQAREYLDLAIGRILAHRGLSAERSVATLTEYAWLLCRDDIVTAIEAADYPQYGAPKIKAFAEGFGWGPALPDEALTRMSAGLPCRPDCAEGCGQ